MKICILIEFFYIHKRLLTLETCDQSDPPIYLRKDVTNAKDATNKNDATKTKDEKSKTT